MRNGKAHDWQGAPKGLYPGALPNNITLPKSGIKFKATGEFRAPKAGEHYLSGAIIQAYRASQDYSEAMRYWIAVPGKVTRTVTETWEPLEAPKANPHTPTCQHAIGEDCMNCRVCGLCKESLDDNDECDDCRTAVTSTRPEAL